MWPYVFGWKVGQRGERKKKTERVQGPDQRKIEPNSERMKQEGAKKDVRCISRGPIRE